jgi:HemY protein
MVASPADLTEGQSVQLVRVLETSFSMAAGVPEAAWLQRIEKAQMANPGDPILQYLAGITCMYLQLWGKAQQLLKHALPRLQDAGLQRNAWAALAELAVQRGDIAATAQAWQNAAKAASI